MYIYFLKDFNIFECNSAEYLYNYTYVIYIYIYNYSHVIDNNIKRKSAQQCGASV